MVLDTPIAEGDEDDEEAWWPPVPPLPPCPCGSLGSISPCQTGEGFPLCHSTFSAVKFLWLSMFTLLLSINL